MLANNLRCIVYLLSWFTDLVLNCSYNVQIWQTWFNHQHVSPFPHISLLKHRNSEAFMAAYPSKKTKRQPMHQINAPQPEWRVPLLLGAADSSVCPQMQVWTVQHLYL